MNKKNYSPRWFVLNKNLGRVFQRTSVKNLGLFKIVEVFPTYTRPDGTSQRPQCIIQSLDKPDITFKYNINTVVNRPELWTERKELKNFDTDVFSTLETLSKQIRNIDADVLVYVKERVKKELDKIAKREAPELNVGDL